ncbi:MAG: twin-arginine translocase subunit TatC [Planctomycetaceae bacterium]
MAKSKDLFDDTSMSFGEHLEVLRVHLWKALVGLILTVIVTLYYGDVLIAVIREPIESALHRHGVAATDDTVQGFDFWKYLKSFFGGEPYPEPVPVPEESESDKVDTSRLRIELHPSDLAKALHSYDPGRYPQVAEKADEGRISIPIYAPEFREFRQAAVDLHRPVTLNVQEAFMMYMKVALIGGLILASPWVFYQLWLFVAAGLYPHERRYIYYYLPVSIGLFLGGAAFCFYVALPVVLDFLLGFNRMLGLTPQIRISEWVSFVITLPLMFGLSFQLPVVMLFLERISILSVAVYRANRRLAILAISIVAMVLTPTADPGSMMLMFVPLVLLYELGILMCSWHAQPLRQTDPA